MIRDILQQVRTVAVTSAALLMFSASSAWAHHGWSEYNNNQTMTLTGQIQSVAYDNPHVTVRLRSGNRTWLAVLAPPGRMQNRGLPMSDLRVGQTVRLVGYAHQRTANELRAERITLGDKTVELR